jgi:hypothetical protein
MVLYFLPRGHETSGHVIYMGRDKVENEDLIAYGWPEDVWCACVQGSLSLPFQRQRVR